MLDLVAYAVGFEAGFSSGHAVELAFVVCQDLFGFGVFMNRFVEEPDSVLGCPFLEDLGGCNFMKDVSDNV